VSRLLEHDLQGPVVLLAVPPLSATASALATGGCGMTRGDVFEDVDGQGVRYACEVVWSGGYLLQREDGPAMPSSLNNGQRQQPAKGVSGRGRPGVTISQARLFA
jgi:hypothetical protein